MNPDSGSIMYNFQTEDDIVVYGDGEQTRDFIHVNDVADIVKSSIAKKWNGKIVEVGTGQSYTINYVAGMFAHFRSKKVIYHDAPKREIKWSIADTSVLRTLYKKPFKTNLERNIRELCQN
jgi:UDP-glucose 4-epimerase